MRSAAQRCSHSHESIGWFKNGKASPTNATDANDTAAASFTRQRYADVRRRACVPARDRRRPCALSPCEASVFAEVGVDRALPAFLRPEDHLDALTDRAVAAPRAGDDVSG